MKKVYYAHSMRTYGTIEEKGELEYIKTQYPEFEIINPAFIPPGTRPKVMEPYLKAIEGSGFVVISEYNGMIGKGVFTEIMHAWKCEVPVVLLRTNTIRSFLGIFVVNTKDWNNYGRIAIDVNSPEVKTIDPRYFIGIPKSFLDENMRKIIKDICSDGVQKRQSAKEVDMEYQKIALEEYMEEGNHD